MEFYTYKGISAGKYIEGEIEALNQDEASHKLKADKIIYVSCNPTTQARDVQILSDNGYNIKNAVMVDMFPHTPHIEMVMLLSK